MCGVVLCYTLLIEVREERADPLTLILIQV
jgi:hypothetical protein